MDFFEHQQQARRHTALMVVLFVLAVAATVAVVDLIGVVVYVLTNHPRGSLFGGAFTGAFARTPGGVHLGIAVVTLGVIGFGSGLRLYDLSAGGTAVANMVGARQVKRDTQDLQEKRLLNLVEEMALASGITVPLAYVMDKQRSINAFAAGYSPNEAVIVVTRGSLEKLNRDELQGVIGHEFSHILNGDMRLNVRLIGVIAGLVMIGSAGRFLMNMGRGSRSDPRPVLLGVALWIVGSVGVLFGSLIKAAISRERELLADASAVQFTRNPDGICGALVKIGVEGSHIEERHADELSHMYFGDSVDSMFGLMDTHPPIEERIERILGPGAAQEFIERVERAAPATTAPDARESPVVAEFMSPLYAQGAAAPRASASAWGRSASDPVRTTAAAVVASVGKPQPAHVDRAQRLLAAIPEAMRAATRAADGAKAVLYALLLGDGEVRAAQIRMIGDDNISAQATRFADALGKLDVRVCMPLLDLVVPTLKVLALPEREAILRVVKQLAEADRRITVHEFVLLTICRRHFGPDTTGAPPVKHRRIEEVEEQALLVLSLLAQAGGGGEPALLKGMAALGLAGGMLAERAVLNLAAVESALYELKLLAPLKKPLVIKACLEVVMADGKLSVAEGELMRAVCAALDSPLPPILDTLPAV